MATGFSAAGFQTAWGALASDATVLDSNTATGPDSTGSVNGTSAVTAGVAFGGAASVTALSGVIGYKGLPNVLFEWSADAVTWNSVTLSSALAIHLGTFSLVTVTVSSSDLPVSALYIRLNVSDNAAGTGTTPDAAIREITFTATTIALFDEGAPGGDTFIKSRWVARYEDGVPGSDGIGDRPPDLITMAEDAPGEDAFFKARWQAIFAEAFPPGADTFVKPPFIQFNEYFAPGGDGFGTNSNLCDLRLRSQYCPDCDGGYKIPYSVTRLSTSNIEMIDPAPFFSIVGPTTTTHGFTIPDDPPRHPEALIEAALSWWRPLTGFTDSTIVNSSGAIGDIFPDDLIAQLQYVLQLVRFQAKITRTGHRRTALATLQFDSHGVMFANITNETSTVLSDETLLDWASHVGAPSQVLSDEGPAGWFDDSECFEVNPFYDGVNAYGGLMKQFSYQKVTAFVYFVTLIEWETVHFEWSIGEYFYEIYHYTCCDEGCPEPGPVVTIPSGVCLDIHLGSSFIDCDDLPGSPGITGPVPEIAAGCSIASHAGCLAHICVPCLTQAQLKLANYMGPYTVTIPTGHECTSGGDCLCEVLVGQFMISASQLCDDAPPSPGFAAIEADGPRQWIHLGIGGTCSTYDPNYGALFAGNHEKVESWRRFRADPRHGTLVMLGKTEGKFQIWLSTDGGQTANKEVEVVATSALLERDSERNWILFYTADTDNKVQVRVSEDGAETFGDPMDVPLDGKLLQARLMDSCQDARSGGRIGAVVSIGKDPNTLGTTAVIVSDDGGLTFRKVI